MCAQRIGRRWKQGERVGRGRPTGEAVYSFVSPPVEHVSRRASLELLSLSPPVFCYVSVFFHSKSVGSYQ